MKLKRILCFLLIAALCFALCGCRINLDERREQVAYLMENGGPIVRNGVEYLYFGEHLDIPLHSHVYVCPPDMPLLAANGINSDIFYTSFDDVFLSDGEVYYCRADKFDEAKRVLENPPETFSRYLCFYGIAGWKYHHFYLTSEQTAAVAAAISEGETTVVNTDLSIYNQPAWYDYDYYTSLTACDDTGWVSYDGELKVAWSKALDGKRAYWVIDDRDVLCYQTEIPAKYTAVFDSIFTPVEEYWESDEYKSDEYGYITGEGSFIW